MSATALADPTSPGDLSNTAAIAVHELVHRYGDRTALNGVSFEVRAAELFGLLGPNGSGKTTHVPHSFDPDGPGGGHAIILDTMEPRIQPLRREIGVVFQAQSIDLKLTAAENLQHQGIFMACAARR